MTVDEAATVAKIAVATTIRGELDPEVWEFWLMHLLPLPYESTHRRVSAHVASTKWCSSLAELLDAAGIPAAARADLTRAVRDGGRFVADLRSITGWSYVAPHAELPRGAVEAAAVAAEPPERAALPPPPPDPERQREVADRLRRLAEEKQASASERRAQSIREAIRLEAELAAADARFAEELELARAAEKSGALEEELVPW